MNGSTEEFWWQNITGPHMVVEAVVSAFMEGEMVALKVPSDLPWRHDMRAAIYYSFKDKPNADKITIDEIDVCDVCKEDSSPSVCLLEKFADSTVQNGYRDGMGVTIQDYIYNKHVLTDRIVWIKGLNESEAKRWLDFIGGFKRTTFSEGLFIVEVCEEFNVKIPSTFREVSFSEKVNSQDLQLFCSFILNGSNHNGPIWDSYISACVSSVCDTDAEVAEKLLERLDIEKDSILDAVKELSVLPDFSRRGNDEKSKHVFHYCRIGDMHELEYRLWRAQMQSIFPIIEMERMKWIERYRADIQTILDREEIKYYSGRITNPQDVEVGTLYYMMDKFDDWEGHEGLAHKEVFRRIKLLRDCRNKLAHANSIAPGEVAELINTKPFG